MPETSGWAGDAAVHFLVGDNQSSASFMVDPTLNEEANLPGHGQCSRGNELRTGPLLIAHVLFRGWPG